MPQAHSTSLTDFSFQKLCPVQTLFLLRSTLFLRNSSFSNKDTLALKHFCIRNVQSLFSINIWMWREKKSYLYFPSYHFKSKNKF
jgi:hypothetical protein